MRRPTLREAVDWIVFNDDTSIPESFTRNPVEYLSGLISVALVADLFDVKSRTVAQKVMAQRRIRGTANSESPS